VVLIVLAGCGRVHFDAHAGTSGPGDAVPDDLATTSDGRPAISCTGLAPTCGPTQTGDCCESPLVPGRTFARSYDVSGDGMYPDPSLVATVSDFRLDRYEVTVGRFRAFIAAGQGTQMSPPPAGAGAHSNIPGSGWDASWNGHLPADVAGLLAALKCSANVQTWTDVPSGNENRPINCIDFYEAMAFCSWDAGYLPTEAEWNYAAAGGDEQRAYPWSSPVGSLGIDETYASYGDGTSCYGPGLTLHPCAATDLSVVGTKPAGDGRWGHSDLAGNVWEYTLDWYASPYPQNPCADCANLVPAMFRVLRGGGYFSLVTYLRVADRYGADPAPFNNTGVRCARPS
jgi:sulfatase modifying factor 1